ncbi:MAG: metal-dependent hydrolase [Nannocystaceae bacterium]
MDAITQGVLGAAAAQALLSHRLGKRTWLYGALGGMAPDLDIFIRSATDPLVAIEYHRNFTHSLAMIPFGGLAVALPFILRAKHRGERLAIALATTAGWATHGLLDAFTAYGTMLFWPFSRERVAWNVIAIVDLGYTLPLIVGVILAARRARARPAAIALAISSLYMAFCGLQRHRALAAQAEAIDARGHHPERVDVFPTLFNDVTWRAVYVDGDRIYADKVRTPWFAASKVIPGASAPRFRAEALPPEALADPGVRRGVDLFEWFASGWLSADPDDPLRLDDQRYCFEPGGVEALWSLHLRPGEDPPVTRDGPGRPQGLTFGKVYATLFED